MSKLTGKLRTNITLLGPAGSGKGYYGRMLAAAWSVPLYSASKILRSANRDDIDLDSGDLVECETVSNAMLSFLESEKEARKGSPFLMDGFPRTLTQIDLMNSAWPKEHRIKAAFHLDVPDEVCRQKINGRRICKICKQEPNIADVRVEGFVLPPIRPSVCRNLCDPMTDWIRRLDDEADYIVSKRLKEYRKHEKPLVRYYKKYGELCSFRPLYGIKDFPKMKATLETWLEEIQTKKKTMTSSSCSTPADMKMDGKDGPSENDELGDRAGSKTAYRMSKEAEAEMEREFGLEDYEIESEGDDEHGIETEDDEWDEMETSDDDDDDQVADRPPTTDDVFKYAGPRVIEDSEWDFEDYFYAKLGIKKRH